MPHSTTAILKPSITETTAGFHKLTKQIKKYYSWSTMKEHLSPEMQLPKNHYKILATSQKQPNLVYFAEFLIAINTS